MKPAAVILFLFCCVAHLCVSAQPSNEPDARSYLVPMLNDSCYEYVDSVGVEYGFRTTNVRYTLLVRHAVSGEKFVMTLYSNYDGLPGPAPMPKGVFCVYRNIITVDKRAYKVASIK